jgi:hypothetical protein
MILLRRALLFLAFFVFVCPCQLRAETLPDRRPAMIGSGAGSLVDLINVNALFEKGQRDAWVMFQCIVAPDGIVYRKNFFIGSPDSGLLKNEIRRRILQSRFIPAVNNHKRTYAWFAGTALFVVTNGQPHLRLYAHQDLDEIRRGTDFVAPQMIHVPNYPFTNFPDYPSAATRAEMGGVLKLRHSVDVNGKTTGVEIISERPSGYGFGEYMKKALLRVPFLPGYRNGKPTATSYTYITWFGQTIGW